MFSLNRCLHQVSQMLGAQIEARGNTLSVVPGPEIELCTDEQKLRQVLINIISNANKFTEGGDIRISVTMSSPDDGVEIDIEDTGRGHERRRKETALTSFGQILERTFEKPQNGTGLGLPNLCRLHAFDGRTARHREPEGRRHDRPAASAIALHCPRRALPDASSSGGSPCYAGAES